MKREEYEKLEKENQNLLSAYPWGPFWGSEGLVSELPDKEVAQKIKLRWDCGYWRGSLVQSRPWKKEEKQALADVYRQLTGNDIEV
jgi:hypothetical protein